MPIKKTKAVNKVKKAEPIKKAVAKKVVIQAPQIDPQTLAILTAVKDMQDAGKSVCLICEFGKSSRQKHLNGSETQAHLIKYIESNNVKVVRGLINGCPEFVSV